MKRNYFTTPVLAAILMLGISLAFAQTNSSIVRQANINVRGNQQATRSATNPTSGQSEIYGIPYLASINLDNSAHENNTQKKTTNAVNTSNITLSYTDNLPSGVGHLLRVDFQQNGVTVYSFWNYQIDGSTIPQGIYTIVLNISNPNSITTYSTSIDADCWSVCKNYLSETTLTPSWINVDLSSCTTFAISSNPYNCGGGE